MNQGIIITGGPKDLN